MQEFANILVQLTSLRELHLSFLTFHNQPPAGFEPVAAALRDMLGLQELELYGIPINYKAAIKLSKLSQVCTLELMRCDLQDASLSAIVLGLASTLGHVVFEDNRDITDGVLPVLRDTMGSLDWGAFAGTSVTREAWELFMDDNSYE